MTPSTNPPPTPPPPAGRVTASQVSIKPSAPKFGGLILTSRGDWEVWTGGKPKPDWSSLDVSASQMYKSLNQLRSSYASSAQKGYNYRKEGLLDKFDHGNDVTLFQNDVMKHLKDTGMDSITYMPDPEDPNKMISVVVDHSRFTIESVRAHSQVQVPLYDEYDSMNDSAAQDFSSRLSQRILEHWSRRNPKLMIPLRSFGCCFSRQSSPRPSKSMRRSRRKSRTAAQRSMLVRTCPSFASISLMMPRFLTPQVSTTTT